jgi:MerR family transcriptional regulator, light-induced transcriptional regulator
MLYSSGQMTEKALLRIGELSRRSGVSPELLRAWERRYDLLQPTRSEGGLRLYSQADLERVQAMQRYLATGLAAAEAAGLAGAEDVPGAEPAISPRAAREALAAALSAFDEARAQAALDALFAGVTLDAALSTVIVPYLHDLGDRWESGEASVAEEHFASGVIRGRLLGLARDWGRGLGPRALLACAPGELHDLGLIAFGLALRTRGWRIGYLGADTPLDSLHSAAAALAPAFVVVSSVSAESLSRHAGDLKQLADSYTVCLGGKGAATAAVDFDVLRLNGDLTEEAERLTELARH